MIVSKRRRNAPARVLPDGWRQWLYGVSFAVLPLLVSYGWLQNEDVVVWQQLIAAVLVAVPSGVAWLNTPGSNGLLPFEQYSPPKSDDDVGL